MILTLRYLHDNLFGLEVDELLYFSIALINSSSENGLYFITCLLEIYSSKSRST